MLKNKSFVLVTISCLMTAIILIGAFAIIFNNQNSYSANEDKLIDHAIEMVNEKYSTYIKKKNYSFSVGMQISETQFVKIDSKNESQKTDIISVSAINKNPVKNSNDPIGFSITFNSKTKEVIKINCEI